MIGLMLLTVVLHEAGHALACLALGITIKRVVLNRYGLGIVRGNAKSLDNALIAFAGPGINILAALLFHGTRFAVLNLVFGIANLIPIARSDGRNGWAALREVLA